MTDEELETLTNELGPVLPEILDELKDSDSNAYWEIQDMYGKQVLSDIEEKHVHKLVARGGPYSPEELAFLMRMAGPDEAGHSYETWDDDENADDSVIDSYAEHLRNYLYTYKDEATQIDPRIDPNEEQIGIMAQDLEKVNPACVKETEEGVKVVDTNKLALMNAGAIADLAREVQELKEALKQLGGKNG